MAATAVGLAGLRHSYLAFRLFASGLDGLLRWFRYFVEPAPYGWPVNLAYLVSLPTPLIASWLVVAIIAWLRPRRGDAPRVSPNAGVMVHFAATLGIAINAPILLASPHAEHEFLPRFQDWANWIMTIPFVSLPTIAAVFAVMLAWVAPAFVPRWRWRSGLDWIERLGRLFG